MLVNFVNISEQKQLSSICGAYMWCVTSVVEYFDWLKKQPVSQVPSTELLIIYSCHASCHSFPKPVKNLILYRAPRMGAPQTPQPYLFLLSNSLSNVQITHSNMFHKICVPHYILCWLANYSAGKWTFLNAFLGECGTPVCMPATWKMLRKRFLGKVIHCISAKKNILRYMLVGCSRGLLWVPQCCLPADSVTIWHTTWSSYHVHTMML